MAVVILGEVGAGIGNRGAATMETVCVVDVFAARLDRKDRISNHGGTCGLVDDNQG